MVDFIDALDLCNLHQFNNVPNQYGRILDLILCTAPASVRACPDPLVPEDPHHPALLIDLDVANFKPLKLAPQRRFAFNRGDYTSIKKCIRDTNWCTILRAHNLNDCIERFYKIIYEFRDTFIPIHSPSTSKFPPWYNSCLVKMIKEKNKYFRKYKLYGNLSDKSSFILIRDRVCKAERQCYNTYINRIENSIASNPKAFWSFVKSSKGRGTFPAEMSYAGHLSDTGQGISELFSTYFHSTFLNNSNTTTNLPNDALSDHSNCDIGSIEIDTKVIEKLLKSLDLNKSAGPDSLPAIFLVNCAEELSLPLSILFKRCVDEGVMPTIWKSAYISPIHKKGPKECVDNYRPISKLCLVSKILERVVYNQLYRALSHTFSPAQHGFLKCRSTVSNLLLFSDFISDHLARGDQVDAIYTDYSKAFDRIDHTLLLKKLHIQGIRDNLLKWFHSYLSNRSQAVVLNGFTSTWKDIPSGVPQGSLLGPLLFIVFIGDIDSCFANSSHLLFADDMKIYKTVNNAADATSLQEDLVRLDAYCADNKLDLNVTKCLIISFSRKRSPYEFDYRIRSQKLARVYSTRDLGVIFDSRFTFDEHIDSVVGKACRALGFVMRSSKPFKSMKTVKLLFCAYVRSHLEYASQVWNPRYAVYINRIERIQRKFTRYLGFKFKVPYRPYEHRCERFHLLPLELRRSVADVIFVLKVARGEIDCPQLLQLIKLRVPERLTRKKDILHVLQCSTNYRQNSFVVRSSIMVNRLCKSNDNDIDIFHSNFEAVRAAFVRNFVASLA
ncbi:unnamed protein product [Plutella xylostella]|uniref:(diamondback moth) hypothetical protein n=1 Tax=Plutella xylostella TaxID=51655 RepID=A0A8S4F0M7_PLUXY|nr:unnamed protein product [Plutella xylostella]